MKPLVDKSFFIIHTNCNMDNTTMEYVKPEIRSRFLGFLGLFAAVIFTICFIAWINSPLIVTVTGSGEISVPATSATVSLTVSGSEASPQGAMDQVKNTASNLRQVLQSNGIEEKEIMESQITAVPAAAYVAGATGYQASITMGAKTLNVVGVAGLVAQLYSAGATVVAQPVLAADKQADLEAKALDEAMKDAKKQANELAKKNRKLIKKVIAIQQASSASTATVTSKTESLGNEFKIAKAVSVSYKMW